MTFQLPKATTVNNLLRHDSVLKQSAATIFPEEAEDCKTPRFLQWDCFIFSLLGCDTVSPKRLLEPQHEGTEILPNVRNYNHQHTVKSKNTKTVCLVAGTSLQNNDKSQ
jgi:hypothetical protein